VSVASALACGSTEAQPTPEPEGCVATSDCGDHQRCQASVCVERIPLPGISAGANACSVISCPDTEPGCCSAATASATGNRHQSYSSQPQMVRNVGSQGGEVRADFRFDAPNQQGWVTFQLGDELDLGKLELTARHTGVADRFLSVNTNQLDSGGCAFAFELQSRTAPEGESFGEVELDDNEFCYDAGQPGRASELAFAIFSDGPGPASLVISNITLTLTTE
jgi:hypothetical protein